MGRSAGRCQQIAASSPHISIEQELFDPIYLDLKVHYLVGVNPRIRP